MGLLKNILRTTAIGASAGIGTFFIATRKNTFVPMDRSSSPLFSSKQATLFNPNKNPPTYDDCMRAVPLSQIKPELLEDKEALVTAFCAGVWGGPGFEIQRRYLERKYYGSETKDQLWSREQLSSSSYPIGTVVTDHFEVVERTPDSIVVRCGDTPRIRDVRPSEGVFEMAADVKPEKGVVEFHLRSVFWQGEGKAGKPPMDGMILFLHQQYDKVLMESALGNVTK